MTTNRTPIRRPTLASITPTALEAFRQLKRLEAQCVGPPDCEPHRRCSACDQWWVEQRTIHDELGLRPWEFAVEREETGDWPADEAARARWKLFEAALIEAERPARPKRKGKRLRQRTEPEPEAEPEAEAPKLPSP